MGREDASSGGDKKLGEFSCPSKLEKLSCFEQNYAQVMVKFIATRGGPFHTIVMDGATFIFQILNPVFESQVQ